MSVSEQLQWEAKWRMPAAILAALGGILPLAGAVLSVLLAPDQPKSDIGQLIFIDDKGAVLVVSTAVLSIGALCVGGFMYYLFVATKARRPAFPSIAKYSVTVGPAVLVLSQMALYILLLLAASDFVSGGTFTNAEAKDGLGSTAIVVASTARLVAQLALGFGIVIICLNAMRVGLLSRFMGVLGCIVGVLLVIPLGGPLPIVQAFWGVAVAFLIARRWPSPIPAWDTGRAEPWPGRQQVMEDRAKSGGGGGGGAAAGGLLAGLLGGGRSREAAPDAAPAAVADSPSTASPATSAKKRKRKKRR